MDPLNVTEFFGPPPQKNHLQHQNASIINISLKTPSEIWCSHKNI